MPKELKSAEEFSGLLETAIGLRVVKKGETAKVKVKTRQGLFTFKTTVDEADSLVKGAKVPVEEF